MRLRVGDVIDGNVVVSKRVHPVVHRMEALCQPVSGCLDGVWLCYWVEGVGTVERRDVPLAARKLRLLAAMDARNHRRARKLVNKTLWHRRWLIRVRQAERLNAMVSRGGLAVAAEVGRVEKRSSRVAHYHEVAGSSPAPAIGGETGAAARQRTPAAGSSPAAGDELNPGSPPASGPVVQAGAARRRAPLKPPRAPSPFTDVAQRSLA